MSQQFLGEEVLESLKGTPYEGFGPVEWAKFYIERYGGDGISDSRAHKAWVLDQVLRILYGTPVEVRLARWSDGLTEYRFSTVKPPSASYQEFVKEEEAEGYEYDVGIPP